MSIKKGWEPGMREFRRMKARGREEELDGMVGKSANGRLEMEVLHYYMAKNNEILVPAYWNASNQYCNHYIRYNAAK